ncbi:STRN3 [Symbiodinium sp. CCMP2592]|nr:STRN3 [Symbiodinium sp. CCMP2592]
MAARFAKLTKAWQNLKLSKSRQAKGMPWLRWEEEEERECEPGAQALTFNCQMVRLMVEHLQQLTLVSIVLLQKVEEFYENQGWDVTPSRIYKDSWGLRKLYSYALRREADCHKRGQTPAGEAVQKLFQLIRELRNTLPTPARKLKGCVKQIYERKKAEEGERADEEQEEEEALETPVRRLQAKTAVAEEEVLFVGSSETKEKKELKKVLAQISELKLLQPDNDKDGPKEADLVDPQMQRSMRTAKKGKGKGMCKSSKTVIKNHLKEKPEPKKAKAKGNSKKNKKDAGGPVANILMVIFNIVSNMEFDAVEFFVHHTMDARQLLKSLEARREQEQLTTPAADLEEAEEPPSKKPRLRKKKSKRGKLDTAAEDNDLGQEKGTPEKPPPKPSAAKSPVRFQSPRPTGGAASSGLERVVDKGEDAQDVWGGSEPPSAPKASTPPPKTFSPKPGTPSYDSATEGWDTKEGFDTKGFDTQGFDTQALDTQALDTPTHAPEQTPKKATPRKSLLASFDEACAQPPAEVLTLPAPRSDSENEDDDMLQFALHNMIEDKDIYGTPLKELFTQRVKHTYTQSRKDKYQKKLIWYYCDIAYEAVRSDKDEEQMSRETGLGEAQVSDVPLGLGASLPNLNSDDEDDVEAEDDDEDEKDEDAEEGTQPTAKLGKRKTKEDLNDVNEDRKADLLKTQIKELGVKHDELADIKSAYDCDEEIDSGMLGSMKLTKLMGQINKLSSRMAMEENKIKKTVLSGAKTEKPKAAPKPDPAKPKGKAKAANRSPKCSDLEPLSHKIRGHFMCNFGVSHELVAGVARAVESEINDSFGEEAAAKLKSYKLLCKMSRGHLTGHAAQKTRDALATMPESQAPIPVTGVDVGLKQLFPCILFSDYLRVLADQNKLNVLTKDVNLEAFWDKMQPLRPQHPIFQLPASARACTIPLYLIGDEGRGYKKSAVFVLGSESLLGDGCDAQDSQTAEDKMKMNFVGNTFLTRQLFACMPKYLYAKKDLPLHKLINIWAEDFAKLFYDGLQIRSGGCTQTWRVAVLGLKADWPALDKLGRLLRHFRRESYPFKHGICHLCMANTRQCPSWHECNFETAPWVQSIGGASYTIPWDPNKESGLTSKIPMAVEDKPKFYLIDLFHTCHKGVSLWDFKLTGSDARGLDKSLEFLFQEMKQFSADRGLYLHMNNLTAKGLLGISSSADFPVGQWFKGADTTFVLKYLIWKYEALQESGALEGHSEAEYLGQILECLRASDGFLSCLYKAGLFLNNRRLIRICRLATAMVTKYTKIAAMAHSRSLPRFKLTPKYHMLLHVVHQLLVDKEANRSPVNPLAYSCQMAEDFINRIATLARSVNPRFVPERTLYLYKVALAKVWE